MYANVQRTMYRGPTHTLDLGPNPPPWRCTPSPPLLTSRGHHWRPVQTCSLEDPA